MFENLYDNIGGKLKNLAIWCFVVEAAGAIITGLALLFGSSETVLYGLLTLVGGPIVAWVFSWLLYAVGELVEKTCDNEHNTREILKLLQKSAWEKETNENKEEKSVAPSPASVVAVDISGEVKTSTIRENINPADKAPYWCGKCGQPGPFDGNCSNCGSSIKIFGSK
ncbi:MAG: hypothetical protein IKU07_02265 [Oscillospiraceae bacterium]|nr:hypothetical protein [Oscillospiraceae bacterium]